MKTLVVVMAFVGLVVLAGCTVGLTPEQATAVRDYESQRVDAQARLDLLAEKAERLAGEIAAAEPGSARYKELWAERDEVVLLVAGVRDEISKLTENIDTLKKAGVPAWSIVLNVAESVLLFLFGGGGISAALMSMVKNAKLKKALGIVVDVVEAKTASKDSDRKAIQVKAAALGVEADLNAVVKSREKVLAKE